MFTSEFPDRTYNLPGGGTEPVTDYLKSIFPSEAAGIDKYAEWARKIVDDNFKLLWTGELDQEKHFPTRFTP